MVFIRVSREELLASKETFKGRTVHVYPHNPYAGSLYERGSLRHFDSNTVEIEVGGCAYPFFQKAIKEIKVNLSLQEALGRLRRGRRDPLKAKHNAALPKEEDIDCKEKCTGT